MPRRPFPSRRQVIAALPLTTLALAPPAIAAPAAGFGEADVAARAQALSRRPYEPPPEDLPASLAGVDYDGYRDVHFDPERALWKAEGLPFQLQFFHRGGLHRERVEMYEVREGEAIPVAYSPDQFRTNSGAATRLTPDIGFAGFRIHAPINRPSYFDEVAVFLGASYFRAVAKDMLYGLSARGLALGVGGADEEFPAFRAFWITRPEPWAESLEVLALMDSPTCAGAFRFVITPGETTVFDVAARLFPRRSRGDVGIAPLTSMFLYGPEGGARFGEARPQIHDSDGLTAVAGAGERIWRPLSNPAEVQISTLAQGPAQGFGLAQRQRRAAAYGDPLAGYEKRPSLWVEPLSDWGPGALQLVELPAHTEYQDNIVALWTPAVGLSAGVEARFAYRLHWGPEPAAPPLARVVETRFGVGAMTDRRRVAIDFALPPGASPGALRAQVTVAGSLVPDVALDVRADGGGARVSFEFDPAGRRAADLRAALLQADRLCSETWIYRWNA